MLWIKSAPLHAGTVILNEAEGLFLLEEEMLRFARHDGFRKVPD